MRIHYEIDDDLHRQAKAAAALQGKTLKEFIEEALAEHVKRFEISFSKDNALVRKAEEMARRGELGPEAQLAAPPKPRRRGR
jgi:hypothetical protein